VRSGWVVRTCAAVEQSAGIRVDTWRRQKARQGPVCRYDSASRDEWGQVSRRGKGSRLGRPDWACLVVVGIVGVVRSDKTVVEADAGGFEKVRRIGSSWVGERYGDS